jgi:hypothetical protein
MATAGAVIARILTQYSDKGSKEAQKDIARLAKKFDDFGKKARTSFALAITASAALSIKIGQEGVQAAIDDAKSQAVLANALKATGDATGKLTAQAEDYIKTTMFRVNVGDELLRASLAQLFIATGDLTQAEKLQTIALDVAAASGKDLAAVTIAITRAQQGNVTSLKRLSPELSGLITQGMKAEEVFALLEGTYGGTAEALADLDPLTKLRLAYGEVLETLGVELLPVVKEFAEYIISDVVPAVDEWIKANGEELRTAIRDIADGIIALSGVFKDFAGFIRDNAWLIKLAVQLFVIGRAFKVAGVFLKKVDDVAAKVFTSFGNLKNSLKNLGTKVLDFTSGDGLFPRLLSLLGKIASKAGFLVTGFVLLKGAFASIVGIGKELLGIETKRIKTTFDLTKQVYGGAAAEKYKAEVAAAAAKKTAAARAAAAAQAAKDAAREAADAAKQKRIDDAVLKLRKQLNITKDSALDKETDLIQLAAATELLKKQGVIAKEEIAKLERLKEENFLLLARDTLAKRYLDIQKVLADQKLETKEIEDLSKSWGISNAAVVAYIHLVKSVEDQQVSTEEIKTLADLWNTSEYEAQKFLETYMRIQDGLLSSSEVFDLISKGFFKTEQDARIYADIVAHVHDGIANDEDFQRVADKWDITKAKVNEYLAAMGADFDYQGTFIDPVTLLATQWQNAAKALQDYLDKLNSAKSFDYNKLGPSGTPVVPPVVVVPPKTDGTGLGGSRTDSAAEAASKAAATAYAIAKAKGDMDAAAKAAAGVRPSDLALGESGAIGALSIANQLKAAEAAQAKAQRDALANFKAAEALSAKNDSAASATMDYDERFRFRNSATMDNSKSMMGSGLSSSGNSTNITVNVSGSVTSEQDLVSSIRQGLLAGQTNGNTLTLQAI